MDNSKKITIKDIARLAGTSPGTVDRVLHNRAEVSEKTREKVLEILKEIEYEPNIVARSLVTKKKFNIAILIPKALKINPYWSIPLNGIKRAESEIHHFGFNFTYFLYDFLSKDSFTEECVKILQSENDIVVMNPFFKKETLEFSQELEKKSVPYIYIESFLQNSNFLSFIGQNAFRSGYMAGHLMNFLINKNASILIVNITKEFDNSNLLIDRTNGFKTYFVENGATKETNILQLEIPDTYNHQTNILDNFLLHDKTIEGIFIPNSRSFVIAKYLKKNKLTHLHLIGYDAIPKNIDYLKEGVIDFLIGQRSEEQGYKAIINAFNFLLLKKDIQHKIFMPIDLLTKENIDFYIE